MLTCWHGLAFQDKIMLKIIIFHIGYLHEKSDSDVLSKKKSDSDVKVKMHRKKNIIFDKWRIGVLQVKYIIHYIHN